MVETLSLLKSETAETAEAIWEPLGFSSILNSAPPDVSAGLFDLETEFGMKMLADAESLVAKEGSECEELYLA